MRPWQHARSSAGRDGEWLADLPIHEFIDSTKAACPDLRHRMILHNADLGPELAARAFPDRPEARAVALRHVAEDLGGQPRLADWLAVCDPDRLPRPLPRRMPLDLEDALAAVMRAQGLATEDGPRTVLDLLLLPVRLAGPEALPVLCNGVGPSIVRQVLGPPRRMPGCRVPQAVFDPAYFAEAIIHRLFGAVPSLQDVVAALRIVPVAAEAGA